MNELSAILNELRAIREAIEQGNKEAREYRAKTENAVADMSAQAQSLVDRLNTNIS
jgi:F0F1-type ATP synthase membrane subunit b/b'